MRLHYREYGDPNGESHLILLHGLFGSSINWQGIARQLQADHHLLVPDLRNHGDSPHDADCSFPAMATDVLQLMDSLNLDSAVLVGHSMGGKVAMWLALHQPQRCVALVVADIAPVPYPDRFSGLIDLLLQIPLESLRSRGEAVEFLRARGLDKAVAAYLLQNLRGRTGAWRWRINLPGLRARMSEITGFPTVEAGCRYPGPVLFVYGGASDYLSPAHRQAALRLFPEAGFRELPGVGHWLYAEDPQGFLAALRSLLALSMNASGVGE